MLCIHESIAKYYHNIILKYPMLYIHEINYQIVMEQHIKNKVILAFNVNFCF
jgi:hypothetical protein